MTDQNRLIRKMELAAEKRGELVREYPITISILLNKDGFAVHTIGFSMGESTTALADFISYTAVFCAGSDHVLADMVEQTAQKALLKMPSRQTDEEAVAQ